MLDDADYLIDLLEGQLVEHGESDEAVGKAVAVREVGDVVVVSLVVVAEMEAQVMEYGQDALVLQGVQQAGTLVEVTADEIEHVSIVGGIVGTPGNLDKALVCKIAQSLVITVPKGATALLDVVELFQLRQEESGIDFRG